MSGTIPPTGPEIAVTMSVTEWSVIQLAVRKAPLPLEMTYPVAARLENQLQIAMTRQRANGSLPEAAAQEQP
jgi:hypothetical protein